MLGWSVAALRSGRLYEQADTFAWVCEVCRRVDGGGDVIHGSGRLECVLTSSLRVVTSSESEMFGLHGLVVKMK